MKTRSSADGSADSSSTARAQDKPDAVEQWPERASSCWSQLTFSYVTPLLRKGAQKTLDPDDLWPASDEERVRTLRGGGRGLRAKLSKACGGLMRRAGCWQLCGNQNFTARSC